MIKIVIILIFYLKVKSGTFGVPWWVLAFHGTMRCKSATSLS